MITPYEDVPDRVAAFRATGDVTAADYEGTLIPTIREKLGRHEKVNLLYHLGPGFKGFTAGAMWDDAKLGLGHIASWDRIALVSDVPWIREVVRILAFVTPATIRVFDDDELPDAKVWVSAS